MERILEPELMDDPEQAIVYARADFEKENQGFVDRFREYFPEFTEGHILDLGCGPGDIPVRFARALPSSHITGVDASAPMPPSPIVCCIMCRTRYSFGTSFDWP